jgi:hypothetical protein
MRKNGLELYKIDCKYFARQVSTNNIEDMIGVLQNWIKIMCKVCLDR